MAKFSFTCTCGDPMTVEAETREEAVSKMKEMMNEEMIAKHMAEKHPGDSVPTVAETHMQIDQNLKEVTEAQ